MNQQTSTYTGRHASSQQNLKLVKWWHRRALELTWEMEISLNGEASVQCSGGKRKKEKRTILITQKHSHKKKTYVAAFGFP